MAALISRTSWIVAVRAFDVVFDFQLSSFFFWHWAVNRSFSRNLRNEGELFFYQGPVSLLFIVISLFDYVWTRPELVVETPPLL